MDILLDNALATMYGPYFLIVYGFFIFFVLAALGYTKIRIDRTDELPTPPIPTEVDPYEIAFLRGGANESARAVVFSLVRKGFAEIEVEGKTAVIKRINQQTKVSDLPSIEQLALRWLGASRETGEVFQPNGLHAQLEGYAQTFQARLEARQMLAGDETQSRLAKLKWAAITAILVLGGYKIIAAVAHDNYNFVGITVMAAFGLIIAASVGKPPRVTKLGKAFLDRLQLAFENLKYQSQAPYIAGQTAQTSLSGHQRFAGVDPLLLSVGVFGSGILAGTVFANYNEAFRRAQQQSAAGSCGSGCGSSCSSGDGGDGGGGCGGCGGGD